MPPGPKPAPSALKEARGNPGKRAIVPDVVVEGAVVVQEVERGGEVVEFVALEPPYPLDDDARAFWDDFVPALARIGVLDKIDRFALWQLATQYGRAIWAGREIAKDGLVSVGSQGQLVESPYVKIERQAMDRVFRMMEHFCGTPIARQRQGKNTLEAASLAAELAAALGGL